MENGFYQDEHLLIGKIIVNNLKEDPNYLNNLLITMTGSSSMPLGGYGGNPLTIDKKVQEDKYYVVHACFNQLYFTKYDFDAMYRKYQRNTIIDENEDLKNDELYKMLLPKYIDENKYKFSAS